MYVFMYVHAKTYINIHGMYLFMYDYV